MNTGFIRGTLIDIPGGRAPVELLRRGDAVFALNRLGTVEGTVVEGASGATADRVAEILLPERSVCLPSEQRVMTDSGVKPAGGVKGGCCLIGRETEEEVVAVRLWCVLAPVIVLGVFDGVSVFGDGLQLVLDCKKGERHEANQGEKPV